jgi:hypothetical protein
MKKLLAAFLFGVMLLSTGAASCNWSGAEPDDFICETDDHKNEPECQGVDKDQTKKPKPRKTKR